MTTKPKTYCTTVLFMDIYLYISLNRGHVHYKLSFLYDIYTNRNETTYLFPHIYKYCTNFSNMYFFHFDTILSVLNIASNWNFLSLFNYRLCDHHSLPSLYANSYILPHRFPISFQHKSLNYVACHFISLSLSGISC